MGAAYCTQADLEADVGAAQFLVLADRDCDGAADPGAVETAISRASEEAESYVVGRYRLPLTADQAAALRTHVISMALYRLAGSPATETDQLRTRYEDAVKWLTRLSEGKVSLGRPGRTPRPSTPVMASSAPRRWGRAEMGLN